MIQYIYSMDPGQAKTAEIIAIYAVVVALQWVYIVKSAAHGFDRNILLEQVRDVSQLVSQARIPVLLAFSIGTGINSLVRAFFLRFLRILYTTESINDISPVCDFSVGVIGTAIGALVGTVAYTLLGGEKLWLSLICGSLGSSIVTFMFSKKSYWYSIVFTAIYVIIGKQVIRLFPIRDLEVADANPPEPEMPVLSPPKKNRYTLETIAVYFSISITAASASVKIDTIKQDDLGISKIFFFILSVFVSILQLGSYLFTIGICCVPNPAERYRNSFHWLLDCIISFRMLDIGCYYPFKNLFMDTNTVETSLTQELTSLLCFVASFAFLSGLIAIGYLKLVSQNARLRLESENFDLEEVTV